MDTKSKILDIAMNLNRIGNWAADGYQMKLKRILIFLNQTSEYLKSLNPNRFPPSFRKTYKHFLLEYRRLEKEAIDGPSDELKWAEAMTTWGNILTHRANLIKE